MPEVVPHVSTIPFWAAVIFNNRMGVMADRKARQGFQAAIDSEASCGRPMAQQVLGG